MIQCRVAIPGPCSHYQDQANTKSEVRCRKDWIRQIINAADKSLTKIIAFVQDETCGPGRQWKIFKHPFIEMQIGLGNFTISQLIDLLVFKDPQLNLRCWRTWICVYGILYFDSGSRLNWVTELVY
jgi:hypothetical protein